MTQESETGKRVTRSSLYPEFCPICPLATRAISKITFDHEFRNADNASLVLTCLPHNRRFRSPQIRMFGVLTIGDTSYGMDPIDATPDCDGLKEEKKKKS